MDWNDIPTDPEQLRNVTKASRAARAEATRLRFPTNTIADNWAIHRAQAERIIMGIHALALAAAKNGQDYVVVMELGYQQINADGSLNGTPGMVYDFCEEKKLNPRLAFIEIDGKRQPLLTIHWKIRKGDSPIFQGGGDS